MLQPGDFLIWRVDSSARWVDRLIGWGESKLNQRTSGGYQYYHVAMVSADVNKIYSSQPPKINLYPTPNPLPSNIEVYRLQGKIDAVGLGRVFAYADSRIGHPYDFVGVLTAGFIEFGGLEFCSQLVEDSWFAYPIELCPEVRFSSPDDIANSEFLKRVYE